MSIFKTRGIVIKTQDYKENDRLVWMFTEKLGKITCLARGVKKKNSKLGSFTQQFAFGDYVIYRGKNLYTINEVELIDSFQGFLGELETITYGSYLCELILIAMPDEESNRELFEEFIRCFYLIKSKAIDYELLIRSFEVKLLERTGYSIDFERCCLCNKKIETSQYINIQYYGGVCSNCSKTHSLKVSFAAFNILRYLKKTPMDKLYRLNVTEELKREIYNILVQLIMQSYSKKPKSLEIFDFIKRSE
ncbi:DNA repair protein RecO [Clostridium sp. DL1XJH146]